METIFIAYFEGGESKHDRIAHFEEERSLRDFFNWIEQTRKDIEKKNGFPIVLVASSLIEKKKEVLTAPNWGPKD